MKIKVLFFGILEDITACKEMELTEIATSNQLKEILNSKYPKLTESTFQLALNQSIITENTSLNNGDTIALLPPFAGG